jgi:hypothetical protein
MTGATVLLVVAWIVVFSLVARSVWAGGPGATLVTARGCALPAGSVLVGGRAAESGAAALGFVPAAGFDDLPIAAGSVN